MKQRMSSTFQAGSIQDRFPVWLCEEGNPQLCNFQGCLNHESWFLLEFPFW